MTLRCGTPGWRRKARTKIIPKKIRDKIVLNSQLTELPSLSGLFFSVGARKMTSVPSMVPIMSPIPLHSMGILSLLLLNPETRRAAKERREQYQRQMK